MHRISSCEPSRILLLRLWVLHFGCFILLFANATKVADAIAGRPTSESVSQLTKSHALSKSKEDRNVRPEVSITVEAQGIFPDSHSRVLNQQRSESNTQEVQCGLISTVIGSFYDESTQTWTVNNALLGEVGKDLQQIVNCATENDTILFETNDTIQPSKTMNIQVPLTLRGAARTTINCPRQGPFLISRASNFTMENFLILGCIGISGVIVLSPRCEEGVTNESIIQLRHLTFQNNEVSEQGHIIEARGLCAQLIISSLVFLRNKCIGTQCMVLGSRNTLTEIYLERNQGSRENSLDSSILFAPNGSKTIAQNVTSLNNEIRSFCISHGDLRMIDSHFDGNRRVQSSVTKENSIGGGVLFCNHSSVSISDTTIEHNYALNGGGVFAWSSNVSITNCRFRENDAGEGDGGAVYGCYSSSFDISSSGFSQNRGYRGAGLYSNPNLQINMVNVNVLENNSSRSGAIWISKGNVRIRSCHLFQNIASRGAGALLTNDVKLSLTNSTFVDNTAGFGGACIFEFNSTVRASNLSFENNMAQNLDGGSIYFSFSGRMRIRDSLFRDNYCRRYGGAVYASGECETNLKNVVFLNNTSDLLGGAVQIWNGNFSGSQLTLRKNKATTNGGAIILYEGYNVLITRSHFEDNEAASAGAIHFEATPSANIDTSTFVKNSGLRGVGGALVAQASNVNISSTNFRANTSPTAGSVAFQGRSNSTILNSTFQSNTATNGGGAILVLSASSLLITNSSFIGNRGMLGGAFYAMASSILLSHVNFVANVASSGGCLFLLEVGNASISDSTFFSNIASSAGGAISSKNNSHLSISNSILIRNHGGHFGGAIHAWTNSALDLAVTRFDRNRAARGGALFLAENFTARVHNCNFTNNKALITGGAIRLADKSTMSLNNSTFSGNEARHGGGLYIFSDSNARLQYNIFARQNTSDHGGAIDLQSSTLFLLSSQFEFNSAADGGSLHAFNSSMKIINSTFKNNHASSSGGAIYIIAWSRARLETTRLELNDAQDCGGICAYVGSHVVATNISVVSNVARDKGGGISIQSVSSLLCYSCLLLHNRASIGGGLHVYLDDFIPIVAQLQNSRFENNSAQSYGGGLHFSTSQNRSISCTIPTVSCGHIVLLNTSFVDNYANDSGAILFTTNPNLVLVDCHYQDRRTRGFLKVRHLNKLAAIDRRQLCSSWKRNRLSSTTYGAIVGTYGQEIALAIDSREGVRLVGSRASGYVLENVRSGRLLPSITVTVLDAYGDGPAPTLPQSFAAELSSPDGFFNGLYPITIARGFGSFFRVGGFVTPGNYTLNFTFVYDAFDAINVTVNVRECQIGEEPTRDGLTCQECDEFSYNFNASEVGGCKECPGDATCKGQYVVPKKGYWHMFPCHDAVQECLVEEACTYKDRDKVLTNFTQNATNCNFNETTIESYNDALCNEGYKGPLCGSCKISYGLSLRLLCLKCNNTFLSLLAIFGITLVLLFLSYFTIRGGLPVVPKQRGPQGGPSQPTDASQSSSTDPEANIDLEKMPEESSVPAQSSQDRQGPSTSHSQTPLVQQDNEYELTKWKSSEVFKIMLNFLQTIAAAATIGVQWTRGMIVFFETSEYVGAMTTDAVSGPVDCMTSSSSAATRATWRMLVSLLVPGAVVGIWLSIWAYKAFKQKKKWSFFWKRSTLSVIAIAYVSYLGLTKMTVRAFYCVNVHDSISPSAASKEKVWATDTSITCYQEDHSPIITIAVVVLCVVTVLFPLMSAALMSRNKEGHKRKDGWVFETAGFLFRAFKESCHFWESIVMFRKACLSLIVVYSHPLGGDSQGMLASLLLFFSLYIHLTFKPYRKEFATLNHLESLSLLVSAATFNLSVFFINDRCSDGVRTLLAVLLIIGNLTFLAVLLCAFFYYNIAHFRVALEWENIPLPVHASWWQVLKAYAVSRFCNGRCLPQKNK